MASMTGTPVDSPVPEWKKKIYDSRLYVDVESHKWPIVYSHEYNISFLGMEKLHPFDAGKWGKVFQYLKEAEMVKDQTIVDAQEATPDDLKVVHPKAYLDSLKWSVNVAKITEVPPVALLPNFIVQRKVLRPFRYHTGGTILAGKLAMERGWAINIGGGFHHCSSDRGGGFCAYADITLSVKFLFEKVEAVSKVMIIDLDAHQGNGHERDFMDDRRVYIMDVYNRGIYPHDGYAKRAIKRKVELSHFTEDDYYLHQVKSHVEGALNEFKPDIIVYNAGTDVLENDPLGLLMITPQGIIDRDQIVFEKARSRNIPIFMVTSGGYQRQTSRIIADSILNLKARDLIGCEEAELWEAPGNTPNQKPSTSKSEGRIMGFFNKLRGNSVSQTSNDTTESQQTHDEPVVTIQPHHVNADDITTNEISQHDNEMKSQQNEQKTIISNSEGTHDIMITDNINPSANIASNTELNPCISKMDESNTVTSDIPNADSCTGEMHEQIDVDNEMNKCRHHLNGMDETTCTTCQFVTEGIHSIIDDGDDM